MARASPPCAIAAMMHTAIKPQMHLRMSSACSSSLSALIFSRSIVLSMESISFSWFSGVYPDKDFSAAFSGIFQCFREIDLPAGVGSFEPVVRSFADGTRTRTDHFFCGNLNRFLDRGTLPAGGFTGPQKFHIGGRGTIPQLTSDDLTVRTQENRGRHPAAETEVAPAGETQDPLQVAK